MSAFAGVILKIRLQRQIGYHITQTYIPSFLFVVLSWLSLFVSPDSIPGKSKSYFKLNTIYSYYPILWYDRIKLKFDAYLYRSCWHGYDDFTYSYCHVWFYTRECSKGFVFLLFRYMDGYMYCICLRIIDWVHSGS